MPIALVDPNVQRPQAHSNDWPDGFDMERVQEAASGPSPLAGILNDPDMLTSLARSLAKSHSKSRSASKSRSKSATKSTPAPTPASRSTSKPNSDSKKRRSHPHDDSVLSLVRGEEERQAQRLKALLRSTSSRLQTETQRADHAEDLARAATLRVVEAERGHSEALVESARAGEELRRVRPELAGAQRELRREKGKIVLLERREVGLEEELRRGRGELRRGREELRRAEMGLRAEHQGKLEEEVRDGMQMWYDDGYKDGFEMGREEGFEEGKRVGFEEERRNALIAFDKYLEHS